MVSFTKNAIIIIIIIIIVNTKKNASFIKAGIFKIFYKRSTTRYRQ